MAGSTTPTRVSAVSTALARDRLGVPAVVVFVMSAAAPLTVVAGVVTTGVAVTGGIGIPVAFVLVGGILALFADGYVAMSRHIANSGAFYTYAAHGLGRSAGVGAAWIALLAYNALQVGLYGAIGAAAAPAIEQWFGVGLHWWQIALAAWALVAVLGMLWIDVNGKVLALLLVAETAVILLFDTVNLLHPAGGGIPWSALSLTNAAEPEFGAVLVLAVLGFVGFEATVVLSEETRDPRRTIPAATKLSIGVIAVLYGLSAWALIVVVGPGRIVAAAREQGPELLFNVAGAHLGPTFVHVGHALFITSVIAAMIAFHNTVARYMFALGREHVLPGVLARTSRRTGAPKVASLVQSMIGLTVIVAYAAAGADPLIHLFFWAGTSGGLGVLFLLVITSAAVLRFFARDGHGERLWSRLISPAASGLALALVAVIAVADLSTLLGVADSSLLPWFVVSVYATAGVLGWAWGTYLKVRRPDVYVRIGLGATAATHHRNQPQRPPRPPVHQAPAAERGRA